MICSPDKEIQANVSRPDKIRNTALILLVATSECTLKCSPWHGGSPTTLSMGSTWGEIELSKIDLGKSRGKWAVLGKVGNTDCWKSVYPQLMNERALTTSRRIVGEPGGGT